MRWWRTVLAHDSIPRSLAPQPRIDPSLFVDASMSFGIGMVMGLCWNAWELHDGWKSINRDIGWAETITLELTVLWLVNAGFNNSSIIVHSDNTGIVGTYNNKQSRNLE